MEYKRIAYVVECFSKDTERLLWEREIPSPDMPALRRVFPSDPDDVELINGSFEVKSPAAVAYVEKLLGVKLDLEKNHYYFSGLGMP